MNNPDSDAMIKAESITKLYGNFTAVQDITFDCKKGEIVGFLGPNGAGKTTTMRVLTGYMPPTSGAAYIAGHHTVDDSIAARQRLGYLPETVPLYPEMRVEDYLAFMGRVRHIDNLWPRIDDVLEAVDLLDRAEGFVGNLSKGMRQRLGLAQALLHDPDVLILDEPTIGLDPAQIVEIRQLIAALGRERTVLLSTHILAEVEQICTRVILVIDGRIWADMSMTEIQAGGNMLILRLAAASEDADQTLSRIEGVEEVGRLNQHEFSVKVDGRDETRIAVAETAVTRQWGLLEMSRSKISLETIFLNKLKEAQAARPLENRVTDEHE
jgi:ABC-2 type transport system ATP-binding protein